MHFSSLLAPDGVSASPGQPKACRGETYEIEGQEESLCGGGLTAAAGGGAATKETGKATDFIVLMSGEPRGGLGPGPMR